MAKITQSEVDKLVQSTVKIASDVRKIKDKKIKKRKSKNNKKENYNESIWNR